MYANLSKRHGVRGIEHSRAYSSRFVQSCPKPTYDTGCTHCSIPKFPQDKQINFEHNLNGTTSIPWKHVLVLSHGVDNFDDMGPKINLIPDSLAHEFEILKRNMLSPLHPVTLSNASISGEKYKLGSSHSSQRASSAKSLEEYHRVRIYPDNVEVEFSSSHVSEFIEHYLLPDEPPQEVYNPFVKTHAVSKSRKSHKGIFSQTTPAKDLVLICGHTQRDVRCGALAPLLQREFLAVLEREGLSSRVDVGLISHIGGHAYAGNVIYFPANAKRLPVTWYGRVFPENVQGIVQATIKGGKIINEMYRGQV